MRLRETLFCDGINFGASGTDDLISGAEDFLGALGPVGFGRKIGTFADRLDEIL